MRLPNIVVLNVHGCYTHRSWPQLTAECGESVLSLCVCENRDGWLVAWGLCGCVLIRFTTAWLLPFALLYLLYVNVNVNVNTKYGCMHMKRVRTG